GDRALHGGGHARQHQGRRPAQRRIRNLRKSQTGRPRRASGRPRRTPRREIQRCRPDRDSLPRHRRQEAAAGDRGTGRAQPQALRGCADRESRGGREKPMDWMSVRAEFPALARWTYLNSATYGQVPRRAVEAMARHSAHRDDLASTDFLDWYTDADRMRASIARLIHAEPEDIAFVPNAAAALSIVLAGLEPGPTGDIVTLDDEFPNYLYQGSTRKVPWSRFYESIDEGTRLAAFSEVNYATGFRPPLGEISRFLKQRGVPLFLDGSQSVGALTFDVRKTPVDVLAVHGYKWLLAPTGAGFMYVSPEFRKNLPPNIVGWR